MYTIRNVSSWGLELPLKRCGRCAGATWSSSESLWFSVDFAETGPHPSCRAQTWRPLRAGAYFTGAHSRRLVHLACCPCSTRFIWGSCYLPFMLEFSSSGLLRLLALLLREWGRYVLIHPYRSPWLVVYVCVSRKRSQGDSQTGKSLRHRALSLQPVPYLFNSSYSCSSTARTRCRRENLVFPQNPEPAAPPCGARGAKNTPRRTQKQQSHAFFSRT